MSNLLKANSYFERVELPAMLKTVLQNVASYVYFVVFGCTHRAHQYNCCILFGYNFRSPRKVNSAYACFGEAFCQNGRLQFRNSLLLLAMLFRR